MPKSSRDIFHKELYVDGFVRVLWIGKFYKIPEKKASAKVTIYWAQVDVDPKKPRFNSCPLKEGAKVQEAILPVGYLTLLHTNTILRNGLVVDPWEDGKLPLEDRTRGPTMIDFSPQNVVLFNRLDMDASGTQIFPVKTDRLKDKRVETNTKCIGIREGDDPYAIIFPCAEILQFFYCTSANMAHALFDGRIQDPRAHLYNETDGRSFGPNDGYVFITLRPTMNDGDARTVASLFADLRVQDSGRKMADIRPYDRRSSCLQGRNFVNVMLRCAATCGSR
jgi:hypothetical protein